MKKIVFLWPSQKSWTLGPHLSHAFWITKLCLNQNHSSTIISLPWSSSVISMLLMELSAKKSVQALCTISQPITWNPFEYRKSRSLLFPHRGTKNRHCSGLDFPVNCSRIDQYFSSLGWMPSSCQGIISFSQRSFQP